ncbi:hypothetical protein POTOM_045523 [Populus tomentosa]|uniref:Uncharacterized protein n=1 Tax=Populus tomentosa TaxID=118781 RepID=A0A8X7YHY6_POPTO|nr:hypothetical protein POTOM_045523 [Populus tomentosa]
MNYLRELRLDGTAIAELSSSFHYLAGLVILSMNSCTNLESILSSISGLKSLKILDVSDCSELKNILENLGEVEEELDLRACNLGEGAVPEDIGCLSSLRILNLSRNNFVSLPESINQLSRLEKLALKDCVMLESLPENGQNNMGLKMLEKYLQGSSPRPRFGIVVLGNEIPGWFTHKSKESSIKVQMPSNYPDGDDNGWMGFAACVAFSAHGKSPLFCHFKVDGKENYPSYMYIGCNSMQALSNHLWLFYLSFDYLKELKEWENEAYSELELSFHSYKRGVKVKNCGVRLVILRTLHHGNHLLAILLLQAKKQLLHILMLWLILHLTINGCMMSSLALVLVVKGNAQAESYTIVFDKDGEDFSVDMEKVRRWMDILTGVAISSESESSKRVNGMDWPVGNRFHGTDMEFVLNFLKKLHERRRDAI